MRGAATEATCGWRRDTKLFLVGGNSNNGANSALGYVNSNNAFSNSNTNRGARNDNQITVSAVVSQAMTSPKSGAVGYELVEVKK